MNINLAMPHIILRFHRRVEETRKFIGDYIYYRKRKHGHIVSWRMARDTL